ncbi:MAG: hypothetical protein JSV04_10805 [Candidatus Heimdallarchaeota archaeon]|nr:MAG: hypothetical protein JSV04_10805 [Candidatus Heimdallarchaeota archaeon]
MSSSLSLNYFSFSYRYSYFLDSYRVHDYDSGLTTVRYYFGDLAFDNIIDYLVIPGWIMILLGILVLFFAIVEFIKRENYSILYWLSILAIMSIFVEWLLVIVIIIQEPWTDLVFVSFGVKWYSPVLNIFLLVIMLIGLICLLAANWLNKLHRSVAS